MLLPGVCLWLLFSQQHLITSIADLRVYMVLGKLTQGCRYLSSAKPTLHAQMHVCRHHGHCMISTLHMNVWLLSPVPVRVQESLNSPAFCNQGATTGASLSWESPSAFDHSNRPELDSKLRYASFMTCVDHFSHILQSNICLAACCVCSGIYPF